MDTKKELNELRDMKKEYEVLQNIDSSKKIMRNKVKELDMKLAQTEAERNQWRDRAQEVSTQLHLKIGQLNGIVSQLELEKKQSTEEIQVLELVVSKLERVVSGLELENGTLKEQLLEKNCWIEKMSIENKDLKANKTGVTKLYLE